MREGKQGKQAIRGSPDFLMHQDLLQDRELLTAEFPADVDRAQPIIDRAVADVLGVLPGPVAAALFGRLFERDEELVGKLGRPAADVTVRIGKQEVHGKIGPL